MRTGGFHKPFLQTRLGRTGDGRAPSITGAGSAPAGARVHRLLHGERVPSTAWARTLLRLAPKTPRFRQNRDATRPTNRPNGLAAWLRCLSARFVMRLRTTQPPSPPGSLHRTGPSTQAKRHHAETAGPAFRRPLVCLQCFIGASPNSGGAARATQNCDSAAPTIGPA